MRCGRIEKMLTPYVDERLGPKERALVEAHLPECGGCRELLRTMRTTGAIFRAMPAAEPPADLAVRAARAALTRGKQQQVGWLDRLFPMAWKAAAGAAVAGVTLMLASGFSGPPPAQVNDDPAAVVASSSALDLDDGVAMIVADTED